MNLKTRNRLIGEIFVELQFIDSEMLQEALSTQKEIALESNRILKLGELLLYAHLVTLDQVQQVVQIQEFDTKFS
jgi:hypothetical protein